MADGNEYQKHIVPLVGGLDLVSPRFFVTPGTLADCLNYETYSVSGYSVVEGIQRYDGTYPCFARDWVVAVRTSGSGDFSAREYLKNGSNYFGQNIYWDSTNGILHYLIINQSAAPNIGDTIAGASSGATLVAGTGGIKRASVYYPDMADYLEQQRVIYEAARLGKLSVYPFISYEQNIIPHGLHWYRSSLFAIADSYQIAFDTGAHETFPGDQILQTGARIATILSVTVTSGSWSTGDAAGTMTLRTDGFLLTNSVTTGSMTIRRPNGASAFTNIVAAFTITDHQIPNSPTAQLFKGPFDDDYATTAQINANSALPGKTWIPVDMGWEIQFTTDDTTTGTAPQTVFRGNFGSDAFSATSSVSGVASAETLDATASVTHPLAGVSVTNPAATALHTVLSDSSTASYVTPGTVSGPSDIVTAYASMTGFTNLANIPDAAIITGIEMTGSFSASATVTADYNFTLVGDQLAGQTITTKTASIPNSFGSTMTLGGDGDLWGLTLSAPNLLAAVRNDPTFGLRFNAHQIVASAVGDSRFSELSIKIYYKTPITAYYAHDPVSGQDLQIGIPYYHLTKGQFNPGIDQTLWATGSMSIYNITPLDTDGVAPASSTWTIGTGWQLRTARHGTGDLIAKFSAQMEAATLPAKAAMDAVRARFEIITANYYANSDWVAMYGVDGVGPAWQYDGYYFYNTYTALNKTEDTPTHICYHRNYAVLGYANGQIIVSVPGSPTDFIPEDGSTLYPFGQRITGLLSLNGTALGVFCESSIYALTGDVLLATDNNNAVSQVIAPYSGAIEYAVQDCGIPLFADFRGISTIDATNKYGDFENGRVSFQITPLLVDRVNDRFAFQATSQDISFAYAVRSKNQCRFVCKDGMVITVCLPIGDRGYEFTLQKYVDNQNLDTMLPVAVAVGTSKSGRDLLFGTFQLLPFDDTNIASPNTPEREVYVYQLDKGTRFDLAPIQHFARLNFMTINDPNAFATLRKMRLELLAQHYFNEYVQLQADYEPTNHVKLPITISPVDQPVRIDKDSEYVVKELEGIGTTLSIEIGGEHIYPGHVLQAMLLYSFPAREQLGNGPTQTL
jgi:hypothetical protein